MFHYFPNTSRVTFAIFLALFMNLEVIHAQSHFSLDQNWVIGISPAIASGYGDLTRYDYDPLNKIFHESGPALGIFAGKKIKKVLEVGLRATLGKTSASRADADIRYKNSFNEIGLYTGISIPGILISNHQSAFDYGIIANLSLAHFRSVSYHIANNGLIASCGLDVAGNKSGKVEQNIHLGGGYFLNYAINPSFTIQLSQQFQFLTTDKFDAFVGSTGINDRLLLSGISIKYTIRPSQSINNSLLECPTF